MPLERFRLIFVRYCGHCRCFDAGACWKRMEAVKPWDTCEGWAE